MQRHVMRALLLLVGSSVVLFGVRALSYQSSDYWYLNWNLFLALLPLGFAWLLRRELQHRTWQAWQCIILSIMWLGFLPNSFYLITDFIHLQRITSGSLLYDIVMLLSFAISGLTLGYLSVALVHAELRKRLQRPAAEAMVAVVFLLCSFAIYLGRYLRWNTWDVLVNPAGLLFDVSDRFINPGLYEQTFSTTALFFVFISVTYLSLWELGKAFTPQPSRRKK